jgi:CheY-like chemotaxis protein
MTTDDSHPSRVEGLRVLVVEDSYFVAVAIGKQLRQLGCRVVGPAPTVAAALELVAQQPVDVALLDINLGSETAEPVADALASRGTPFVFVTGYSSPRMLNPSHHARRRLVKPVTPESLHDTLAAVVSV